MATDTRLDHGQAVRLAEEGRPVPETAAVAKRTLTPGTFEVDEDASHVELAVNQFGIWPVEATLRDVTGRVELAEAVERSGVELRVRADSVQTGVGLRDAHLRSRQFLAAGSHPQLHFVSEHVQPLGAHTYAVHGALTIRGVTAPAVFNVSHVDVWHESDRTFTRFIGTADVERGAFGIPTPGLLALGGLGIDNAARVRVHVQASRPR